MVWLVEFFNEEVKEALDECPLGKSGIARAIYVTAVGKRIVIVHVFQKKTQKTHRREIETALKRAKEIQ